MDDGGAKSRTQGFGPRCIDLLVLVRHFRLCVLPLWANAARLWITLHQIAPRCGWMVITILRPWQTPTHLHHLYDVRMHRQHTTVCSEALARLLRQERGSYVSAVVRGCGWLFIAWWLMAAA
jgi:hypothetical protein